MENERVSETKGGRHKKEEVSEMENPRKLRAVDFGYVKGADTYRQIVLSCRFCDEVWISEPIGSTSSAMDDDCGDYVLQVSWASGNVPEIDDPEDMSDEERSSMAWMLDGHNSLACPTCAQNLEL